MFRFTEPSSGQFLKTQYHRVRTLWDPILFTDYFTIKAYVEAC